jgi:hypothetical protein
MRIICVVSKKKKMIGKGVKKGIKRRIEYEENVLVFVRLWNAIIISIGCYY